MSILIFLQSTYWCVNKVQQIFLPIMLVDHGSCLCLDCNASLSLHLKLVQNLFVVSPH